jgi:hypothetical protein
MGILVATGDLAKAAKTNAILGLATLGCSLPSFINNAKSALRFASLANDATIAIKDTIDAFSAQPSNNHND